LRKRLAVGLVVVIVAAAAVGYVYTFDPLISKLDQLLSGLFGSASTHISYKVSSRNETNAMFDLYLDDEPDPFYSISFAKWGGEWMVESHGVWPNASSPAKGLIIEGYNFRDGGIQVVVRNPTGLVALIDIIEVKLENPAETHHGRAGTAWHGDATLVAPGETRALGSSWGISWEGRGSLPEDALAGKSFTVTITLKDGKGEVVGERSSTHRFQPGEAMGTPTASLIEIESAVAGGSIIQVRLITLGTDPTINAVYVTPVDGTIYGGDLTPRIEFSPLTSGTIVSVDIQKLEGGVGKILTAGDIVAIVCVDAGSCSTTVTQMQANGSP